MIVDSTRPQKPPEKPQPKKIAKMAENFLKVMLFQYGSALTESSLRSAMTEATMLNAGVAAWPTK